ncbi:hypothetical protein Tco_1378319 [Tanacetum coccineum]
MASTRASISKVSKRPKINIIPPKQLFVDLTQDDTKTPSPKLPNSSPSAPNAPSKTPSTKDTSSSSIDYIPKSPTSSTSPSPNGYLNPSTSPPPRVSPPPPTQDNASMDITLTLSPNTPLDVQFDTPSPSPPIIAHPIPWNFLEAHVTPHYLLKVRECVLAKPHDVIAPGSSRNSQEESYGSNDMAYNHYQEEARKKTQERNRNSKPSVMHTTSLQNTTNGSKPNPRSNNQISRSLPVSKSSCGMSNGVAKVNSRAKVQSPKTRNNTKPVEPKSHTQKPSRQIAIGQRFSPKKSSAVHEKPNTPRSCLRWKPTGRIFKIASLRWIPTGKMFTDYTTKVDSEPPNGSNDDITNPYECDQTLNVSAGLVPQSPSPTPNVPPTKNDWDSLFCPMFDEYFNPSPSVVQPVLVAGVQEPVVSTGTPSSTRIDQDTPSTSTSQTTQEEQSHVIPTSVEEDNHVNQPQEHIEKWTKDHPLDKIIGDPSRPVSTRLQLQTEALFCYYDALLSSSEHKSYKDALTESCWIDAMKSSMSWNAKHVSGNAEKAGERNRRVMVVSLHGEAVEASKKTLLDHRNQQLSNGSSEGSGTTPEVPDEPKDNSAVVAKKQAGYVQTNLTLTSAELEIQSMVDVPIHQEDLAVQQTPLIDHVISMVYVKRPHHTTHHQPHKLVFKCVQPLAGKTFQEEFRSVGWCKENNDGQKIVVEDCMTHSYLI